MTDRPASLPGRFWAYLGERFPLPVILLLSLAFAGAATAVGQARALAAGAPLSLDGTALGGVFMVLLFLFHLRVFDEHKDYEIDQRTRPDRPVQRGLITLNQLKVAGVIAVAAEIVLALLPGPLAAAYYALPLGFSLLMFFEFFAGEWLSARLFLYAFSHTLVMPLVALALIVRTLPRVSLDLPPAAWGLLGLAFTSAFAVDVLRKTWAPESEIEGLDSYSKRYGIPFAVILGGLLLTLSGAIAVWIGWQLGGRLPWLITVAVITGWGYFELSAFAARPTPSGAKHLEMVGGLHHAVVFIGLIVVAAAHSGVILSLADHAVSFGVAQAGGT